MSDLTEMVLMPGADYRAICNAVRTMTGGTDPLTSGELAAAIRGISGGGGLGKLLYRVGALADAHVPVSDGANDLSRAVTALQDEGVSHIVIAGDLGMYRSNAETELQQYQAAVADAPVPIYAANGNHDVNATDANGDELWQAYVGHPLRHVIRQDQDVFIVLGMDNNGSEPYSDATLGWLEDQLALYSGRRIFIINHYPLPGYAGLKPGGYYGYSAASTGDDRILAAMTRTGNVVLLSGHTHYRAEVEDAYNGILCQSWHSSDCAAVHVPSVTRPRDAGDVTELTPPDRYDETASQGLIVEAYERGLIVRVMDFVAGAYLERYEHILPIHSADPGTTNMLVLSVSDITVPEGGSAMFDVSLYLPPAEPVTVRVASDNGVVSVTPSEMVFTPDNYATAQTVTVIASEDEATEDVYSIITVSADEAPARIVSATVVNNDIVAYAVDRMLRYCTISNTASAVPIGGSYSTDIVAADGYERPAVRVTMGGADITATAYADGHISIAEATGDITITAVAFDLGANLVPQSIDAELAPYNNGIGYKPDTRLTGGGGEGAYGELISTGFIPVRQGDTLYFGDWTMLMANGLDLIALYGEDFGVLTTVKMTALAAVEGVDFSDTSAVVIPMAACITAGATAEQLAATRYVRICAREADAPVVSLVAP